MKIQGRLPNTIARARLAGALSLVLVVPVASAHAARVPAPVSPGATTGALVEARCPTFLWSGVVDAVGYELAVFRVSGDGGDPVLVTRASVPGDARGWTPASSECLERGEHYAWSVAATGNQVDHLDWSPPFLFEVEAAPSLDELARAIATIERYRARDLANLDRRDGSVPDELSHLRDVDHEARAEANQPDSVGSGPGRPRKSGAAVARVESALPGALAASTSGVPRAASAPYTPMLGTPSLFVSRNVSLGFSSNLFKSGKVFLWDDTVGNTALGREALASVYGGSGNTAVGRRALQYTVGGPSSLSGSANTAIGDLALRGNTTGFWNTATGAFALGANAAGYGNTASGVAALQSNVNGAFNTALGASAMLLNTSGNQNTATGVYALRANTTGLRNTASGYQALHANVSGANNVASGVNALLNNTTGTANTAIGYRAGRNATTGSHNIFVGSGAESSAGETNTIRVGGSEVGNLARQQNRTFINGIRGVTTEDTSRRQVLIDANGQLGTETSSRATKQDIEDLGWYAERLLALHPVVFRYRQDVDRDPDAPVQFGLIAEEVAQVFPELVVFDEEGRPETVRYHLLGSLLLEELRRQHQQLERYQARLEALEGTGRRRATKERRRAP
jgi:hypothetical protein